MSNPKKQSFFERMKRRVLGEKFKGFIDIGKHPSHGKGKFYPGERTWVERCDRYNKMCESYSLAKQSTTTIAGQLVAEGVFTEPYERPQGETYPRAEEAKHQCDLLNERVGMDSMLFETGLTMAKFGSCFWEKTFQPVFDMRIIPMQEAIEPASFNDIGEITSWRQNLWGRREMPTWTTSQIIHFAWNVTSRSWPYGTSILSGLETSLETLEELEVNANEYMKKQAWPYELWQVGDGQFMPTAGDMSTIDSKWKNRSVGENMLSTYPIDLKQGGTGGAPIRELSNLMEFIKDDIIDGTNIPPISKQYNATEASAKVMMPHAHATIITPMQRIIRRQVEGEGYKPYLEDLGYSVKTCPKLTFAPPDAHKETDGEYYSKGVLAGIFPPRWAAKKLGVPEEEFDEWMKEEEQRREEEAQSLQQNMQLSQKQDENQGNTERST